MERDVCIVGGGPAGMMAGLLFARAGARTTVIEKHADFRRDFRGDAVHPSTLDLFDELGLLKGLLERPHDKVRHISAVVDRKTYRVADFSRLPGRGRFIAMMPQWEFLDFVAAQARHYPGFELLMETEATGLIGEGPRVAGVRTNGGDLGARLVIAADGRGSALRAAAGLPRHDLRAPIDVFWFRIPKAASENNRTRTYIGAGELLVTIDRGDHFQCARMIRKGTADRLRQLGLQRFRMDVARTAPPLAGWLDTLDDWDGIQLLGVSPDRLRRWWRPGLLAIGDAAHVMSPVGGVGINLAIQDAVAAANILAGPLAEGADVDPLLRRVQARRMSPTMVIQSLQCQLHDRLIGRVPRDAKPRASLTLRLLNAVPPLQRLPGRLLGLGVRREHIRSPVAGAE